MSDPAQDHFERYFAEKMWEMIPSIYRHEDGLAANRGVLRALVGILAEQAAILRRSHDRLWNDQFIELCDDWAVPYLGDLVATRMISALNPRGRRVDVAKTIYYRRRKGTVRVLEELISDIAGWEGKVVEQFRRLGRTRHGLDPHPVPLAGRYTGTPPGGTADLRNVHAAQVTGGPFDEFYYTPDMRRHNGVDGLRNISKIAFYLYRLPVFRIDGVTPFARSDGVSFTFDPSGRDIPLFVPRNREENWDDWRSALEWEMPAPMSCRLLANQKGGLIPDAVNVSNTALRIERTAAGDLSEWSKIAPEKDLIIDPERGRFLFLSGPPETDSTVSYHYGFSGEIGAGTYSRADLEMKEPDSTVSGGGPINASDLHNTGMTRIDDSASYGPISDKLNVQNLTLQAANQQRPYIRMASNWVLRTASDADAKLHIDGVWFGSDSNDAVILRGDYEHVIIRCSTFDPGGSDDADGNPIWPVPLIIEAKVETLIIESSIMGPIRVEADGVVECLRIQNSIIDATAAGTEALSLVRSEVELTRVTVFGDVDVNRLWASDTIITGVVDVTDTQNGCFRFSAAPDGSRVPRAYESHFFTDSAHFFTSRRFDNPAYGQLSQTAPPAIQRGAENGSEMGAFSSLLNPIKLDSLRKKVDEYLPFGLIPVFLMET